MSIPRQNEIAHVCVRAEETACVRCIHFGEPRHGTEVGDRSSQVVIACKVAASHGGTKNQHVRFTHTHRLLALLSLSLSLVL